MGFFDIGPFRYVVAALLVLAYALYVRNTMKSEGDLEGECRALYFHRTAESPQLKLVILQIVVALVAIIFGANLFVDNLTKAASALGVPALVISLLLTPFATELPEKFNSVVWMGQKKDTLALGNITGAMVFQSAIPVAIGIAATKWQLYDERRLARDRWRPASRCSRAACSTDGCGSRRRASGSAHCSSEGCCTWPSWA